MGVAARMKCSISVRTYVAGLWSGLGDGFDYWGQVWTEPWGEDIYRATYVRTHVTSDQVADHNNLSLSDGKTDLTTTGIHLRIHSRFSYRIFGLGVGELFVHQQSAGLGAFLPPKFVFLRFGLTIDFSISIINILKLLGGGNPSFPPPV